MFNLYPAEFVKWTCPPSIFGTVHYQFKGYQEKNLRVGQATVQNLVRMHKCADWPGCILVAKTIHIQFQQGKG